MYRMKNDWDVKGSRCKKAETSENVPLNVTVRYFRAYDQFDVTMRQAEFVYLIQLRVSAR